MLPNDPRHLLLPEHRPSEKSALLQLKERGEDDNICPYGCTGEELTEHGYCYHLVGFANCTHGGGKPPVGARVERMVLQPNGVLGVHVPFKRVQVAPGKFKRIYDYDRVQKGDILHQISTSYRVYRNVPRPEFIPQEEMDVADDDVEELVEEEAD